MVSDPNVGLLWCSVSTKVARELRTSLKAGILAVGNVPSGQADPSQQRTVDDEGSSCEPMSEDQIWTPL